MTNHQLISCYEQLDEAGKQQIENQLLRLLDEKPFDRDSYRQQLLKGSVWTEEDVLPIREAREHLSTWRTATW